jgi:hypothetical protein
MDPDSIRGRQEEVAERPNESCGDAVERILRDLTILNRVEDQADAVFAVHRALTESDFRYPLGAALPVPSPVRDGIEFSLSLSANGTRSLRYVVDIMKEKQNLAEYIEIAKRRAESVLRILMYNHHKRFVNDLFRAAFGTSLRVSDSKFISLFGMGYKCGALPTLKLYLNLEVGDRSQTAVKAYNVLHVCGLERTLDQLREIVNLTSRDIAMVGVDISSQSDPRVKCYMRRSRHVRREEAKSVMAGYSGKGSVKSFDAFNKQVLGNPAVYPYKSIQFSCGLSGDGSLDSIRMDARVKRFNINDTDFACRIKRFLIGVQLDFDYYKQNMIILNQCFHTNDRQSLHVIAGLSCRNGYDKINIYIAPNFLRK